MICLDASVAAKLILDEPWSDRADALVEATLRSGKSIVAPPLLRIEVTNIHLKSTQAVDGLSLGEAVARLETFLALPIEIRTLDDLHRRALVLAHEHGLPAAYDAHYLALAEALQCALWTDDRRLLRPVAGRLPFVHAIGDFDESVQ
jgi:predicted nucleic acid-binding protein